MNVPFKHNKWKLYFFCSFNIVASFFLVVFLHHHSPHTDSNKIITTKYPATTSNCVLTEKFYKEYTKTDRHRAIDWINLSTSPFVNLTSSEVQQQVFNLVVEVCQMFEKSQIEHWIDWGTLLGSFRESDIIPWDDDGDIAIRDQSFSAVVAASPTFQCTFSDVLFVNRYQRPERLPDGHPNDIPFMILNRTSGVYVDVFMYRDIQNNQISNRMKDTHSHFAVSKSHVFPLKKTCKIRNVLFYCPKDPVEYLDNQFTFNGFPDWRRPVKIH
eukprot:PhF_6_TR41115/c0_g1_i1/m.62273